MTKCEYGKRRVGLDRHKLVEAYDDAGMDEGRFMVTLTPGFAFDDPVQQPGDDERMALHCRSFGSVKEAVEAMRYAQPCRCSRCSS